MVLIKYLPTYVYTIYIYDAHEADISNFNNPRPYDIVRWKKPTPFNHTLQNRQDNNRAGFDEGITIIILW